MTGKHLIHMHIRKSLAWIIKRDMENKKGQQQIRLAVKIKLSKMAANRSNGQILATAAKQCNKLMHNDYYAASAHSFCQQICLRTNVCAKFWKSVNRRNKNQAAQHKQPSTKMQFPWDRFWYIFSRSHLIPSPLAPSDLYIKILS